MKSFKAFDCLVIPGTGRNWKNALKQMITELLALNFRLLDKSAILTSSIKCARV